MSRNAHVHVAHVVGIKRADYEIRRFRASRHSLGRTVSVECSVSSVLLGKHLGRAYHLVLTD